MVDLLTRIKYGNADYSEIITRIKRICFWSGIDTVIFQVSPESFLDQQ